MVTTITRKFSEVFNAGDMMHVMWFKKLHLATLQGEKEVESVMNINPFGIKLGEKDLIEYINIQFILAMKYSTCVLDGKAWVPSENFSKV